MQYVNDDMDDFFRRAGKDYPLDTSGADWDKIAPALQSIKIVSKKGFNNRYLFLLLLLPLPWLCMKFNGNGALQNITAKHTVVDNVDKQSNHNTADLKEKTLLNEGSATVEHLNNSISFENTGVVAENANSAEEFRSSSTKTGVSFHRTSQKKTNPSKDAVSGESAKASALTEDNDININQIPPVIETAVAVQQKKEDGVSEKTETVKPVENSIAITETKTKRKTNIETKERFYIAPVAGFSVTTIKGQKLSDPGMDYGILAGIKLSRRFSLEAGILSSRKNYYSEGSYYDKSKIYMPANSKLTTVSGDCRMVEIPVTVRYDFKPEKRSHWFTTAGISNYLMKKENYDYTYYYYSTNYYATYHKTYEKSSRDWMSVIQLSGGYNYYMKHGLRLRFEPYAQLPLKGAGYGDLPLTSYGIRLGIEKGFRF